MIRASFWKGREKELAEAFAEIASRSDILIGNEEDFQLCLGIQGPDAGGQGLDEKIEGFKEMIGRVQQAAAHNLALSGEDLQLLLGALLMLADLQNVDNAMTKAHLGRLSAVCSCSVAAGSGARAASCCVAFFRM